MEEVSSRELDHILKSIDRIERKLDKAIDRQHDEISNIKAQLSKNEIRWKITSWASHLSIVAVIGIVGTYIKKMI